MERQAIVGSLGTLGLVWLLLPMGASGTRGNILGGVAREAPCGTAAQNFFPQTGYCCMRLVIFVLSIHNWAVPKK
jgi:hypothetical protein